MLSCALPYHCDILFVKQRSKKQQEDASMSKAPVISTHLRRHIVETPPCIRRASGVIINGVRIKSLLFSTDVAIIRNSNADAVIAVYPFTPTIEIARSIISIAQRPVFVGVGGGTTFGPRVSDIALDAELNGAIAVVLNAPTKTAFVKELSQKIDIPIVLTVVSERENLRERMDSGAMLVNVSGGVKTASIVRMIRDIAPDYPIIATGGPTEQTITRTIEAGANAITYTPPTNGEIFSKLMQKYRDQV